MFELTTGAEVLVLGGEVRGRLAFAETGPGGWRGLGGGGGGSCYRMNVCLITLNGSANGLSILNILNGFGGF